MTDTGGDQPHRDTAFFVELVLAGLVVFAVAVTIGLATGAQTGSVADWVAGISTFAAFIAAVLAGKFALDALKLEQGRDRFRDEQLTRGQAERVAAWIDYIETVTQPHASWRPPRPVTVPRLLIRNASDLPVLNLRAAITARSRGEGVQRARVLGAIDRDIVPPTSEPERRVLDEELQAELRSFANEFPPGEPITLTVGVIFTDTGGRHWIRDDDGDLRLAPPSLAAERDRDLPI